MAPLVDSGHDCHLEAGLLPTAGEEKATTAPNHAGPGNSTTWGRPPAPTKKMMSLRRAVLAMLACFVLGFGLATATSMRPLTCNAEGCDVFHDKATDAQTLGDSKLLQFLHSASPDALHEFLHKFFPDRYQHGVYESDHEAVEAVFQGEQQDASPTMGQLAKRQEDAGNTTVTTSSSVPSDTSTDLPTDTFTTPTPTTSESSSETPTTSPPPDTSSSSSSSTSSSEPETSSSTPSETPTPTSSSSSSSSSGTSTAEETSSSSTSPSPPSSSSEPVSTSTSTSTEETPSETPTPTSAESTSFSTSSPVPHTFTTTQGDGGTTVVTTTSWVGIGAPAQTTEPNPDLQDDASRPRRGIALPAAAGLLVAAVMMA